MATVDHFVHDYTLGAHLNGQISESSSAKSTTSKKPASSLSGSDRQSFRSRLPSCDTNQSYEHRSEEQKSSSWIQQSSVQDMILQHPMDSTSTTQSSKTKVITCKGEDMKPAPDESAAPKTTYRFPNLITEVVFGFAVCMTQFMAEYLISGFALQLPDLSAKHSGGSLSALWPASLLSLIMGAMLLIFARLVDIFGGYYAFLFGWVWLAIWTLIPGLHDSATLLDISRAMQGLALAAFMPSTFAILSKVYADGKRKRSLLCIYSAFNPLGFFGGFMVAGALPESNDHYYWIIGSVLSAATAIAASMTMPRKDTTQRDRVMHFDWYGSIFITGGLVLITYALSAEPYSGNSTGKGDFASPEVLAPFLSGVACLAIAVFAELKLARCPLLPLDFFKPERVKSRSMGGFMLACMCFYASFGVWLYFSVDFFQNPVSTSERLDENEVMLGLWYLPLAVEGLILCVFSGPLFNHVRTELVLLFAALTWIAAPTLLAMAPLPLGYWSFVFPSMLCATAGINLTFTISCVFLTKVQPAQYQGLCGAICSMMLGLALAFSLPIAQIVMTQYSGTNWIVEVQGEPADYDESRTSAMLLGFHSAFWYATASAGMGLLVGLSFVRFPRQAEAEQAADQDTVESGGMDCSSQAPDKQPEQTS